METNENDIRKLSSKKIHLEKKMLVCETNIKQLRGKISDTAIEEDNNKNIVQIVYDRGLSDNFPNKDEVIESYLEFDEDYLLKKEGKEIVIVHIFHSLSDLE